MFEKCYMQYNLLSDTNYYIVYFFLVVFVTISKNKITCGEGIFVNFFQHFGHVLEYGVRLELVKAEDNLVDCSTMLLSDCIFDLE